VSYFPFAISLSRATLIHTLDLNRMNESSYDFASKSNRMILSVEDGINEDLVSLFSFCRFQDFGRSLNALLGLSSAGSTERLKLSTPRLLDFTTD
jgi:hypothetical protein